MLFISRLIVLEWFRWSFTCCNNR